MGKIGLTLMPALDWSIIKNLAIENESNANLFITELNEKAENALDNRLIDVSDLTKEELYYHLSSIIPLFCFFKYRTDLEKYLKSIFERSVNLNLLLNQKIDIKLLYSTSFNFGGDLSSKLIYKKGKKSKDLFREISKFKTLKAKLKRYGDVSLGLLFNNGLTADMIQNPERYKPEYIKYGTGPNDSKKIDNYTSLIRLTLSNNGNVTFLEYDNNRWKTQNTSSSYSSSSKYTWRWNKAKNKLTITLIRSAYRRVIEINDKGVSYLHQNYDTSTSSLNWGDKPKSSTPLEDPHIQLTGRIYDIKPLAYE